MLKSTFIIIEKSYLIRKGLVSVIEKIPQTTILQFENDDEFNANNNLESDFIIISPTQIGKNIEKLKNTKLIAIVDRSIKTNKDHNFCEYIYIDDTQSTILKKFNDLIGTTLNTQIKSEIPDEISKREVDILKEIALGLSNKEIAEKLFISTHTVVTHRKNITRKLGIKTVPGLTIYAILNKIININDTEQS